MGLEGLSEIFERVAVLANAGLPHRKKSSGGHGAGIAPVSETGFAPLHGGSQRSFRAVVGWFNSLLVDETE